MPTIPDRVLDLIDRSGLTRHAFALRVGLDDSKLSKSLNGTRRFSSLDLARIAEEFKVTVDWLVTGEEPPLAVAARTTTGDAAAALDLAKRYSTMRTDMTSLGYPQPWEPLTGDPDAGGYREQGTMLARDALRRMGRSGYRIGDPDLPAAVERAFGVDVAVVALASGFDGLAAFSDTVKLILLATSQVPYRQRFTLAHELGHLLDGDDQEIHLDRDVFDKAQTKDPSERRANAFAAELLMPEDLLRNAVGRTALTEQTFATLACDLMVTPSALAYRMLHLRLIDAGTCDRYKILTASAAARIAGRGEQFAQQVSNATTPRPPGLLVRDTYAAYESGKATLRPYASLLGVDVEELRRVLESDDGTPDAL